MMERLLSSLIAFAAFSIRQRSLSTNTRRHSAAGIPDTQTTKSISPTNLSSAKQLTINLFSLPPKDDKFKLPGETLVRECWRWKDSSLGDGRDYFVPRPRALKAFQSLLLGMEISVLGVSCSPVEVILSIPSSKSIVTLPLLSSNVDSFPNKDSETCSFTFKVVECVALSNCARFETILVLEEQQKPDDDNRVHNVTQFSDIAGRYAVGYRLQQQVSSQRSKSYSLLQRTGLGSWLDLPGAVDIDCNLDNRLSFTHLSETIQLAQRLSSIEGAYKISSHLSLIAGGLAPRPNRPDREVIFRPYSSRDAHILLQLKRTVEVVSVADEGEPERIDDRKQGKNSIRGRIKTLLDGALSAGKAARNEAIVPEITQLKEYGSDGTPPKVVADVVARAAIERAIQPSIESCLTRLKAMETADDVKELRKRVNEITLSISQETKCESGLLKIANELLHEPTMLLREGKLSRDEIGSVVRRIEDELRGVALTDNKV